MSDPHQALMDNPYPDLDEIDLLTDRVRNLEDVLAEARAGLLAARALGVCLCSGGFVCSPCLALKSVDRALKAVGR